MSRHELAPAPEAADVTRVAVGWDRPLQTYFAQFFVTDEAEEERVDLWIGTEPGELPTSEAAIAVIRPYAVIPVDLAAGLDEDVRAAAGTADGPEQRRAKEALFGRLYGLSWASPTPWWAAPARSLSGPRRGVGESLVVSDGGFETASGGFSS